MFLSNWVLSMLALKILHHSVFLFRLIIRYTTELKVEVLQFLKAHKACVNYEEVAKRFDVSVRYVLKKICRKDANEGLLLTK